MQVRITSNEQVAPYAYKMILAAPAIAKAAKPGQFVMARATDSCQPLLRRPFGVHSVKGNSIEILYEIIGEGTKILSQKKPGGLLDIIGPLGNGFIFTKGSGTFVNILVAGGMGVAPLIFLAEKLMERKTQSGKRKVLVLLGAKTKSHLLCEKEFKALGCDVRVATDDGSKGHKGFITEILNNSINSKNSTNSICACGPNPMLKAVAKIARDRNITAQVSLEEHMACGIGACLGCIVNTKQGQKRVCKDGPIFNITDIAWR